MCGLAGFLDLARRTCEAELQRIVGQMADTLRHRGPDDRGVWADAEAGIALGHRRLAILDLSPKGHQPMLSSCGRFVAVYNGEIYNFLELRRELAALGHEFRGNSDTEVMLAAFRQWGVEASLKRFNGMFAIALWDKQNRVLHLMRDRVGKKPLYYGWMGKSFLFGSELKAFREHPGFRPEVDRDALTLYLRHSCIPSPYSIYRNIRKLLPGTCLTLRNPEPGVVPSPVPYWSAKQTAEQGVASPFQGSEEEAIAECDRLLRDAVGLRMIADVPLGAFLSGGIDSSLVVALMQAQSTRPAKTFSIGFHEASYNEAGYAKAVAKHLGTEHTELYLRPEEAMSAIPRLPAIYDEPFADSSQIPTFLISELTRRHVTVSLSGDGGDELFGGYDTYSTIGKIWGRIGWMPQVLKRTASYALGGVSTRTWDSVFQMLAPILPDRVKRSNSGERAHRWAKALMLDHPEEIHHGLMSSWEKPSEVVLRGREPLTVLTDRSRWAVLPDVARRMMYLDLVSYLPDDILVKVDRASMSVSLEARAPLLDHRVVEFASRLPLSMAIRRPEGKWLLRRVLYRYVPRALIDRPKMGFSVPLGAWLKGPLREWAEELLSEQRIRQEGYFAAAPVRRCWAEYLSGARRCHTQLWVILMFHAWLDENKRSHV